MLYINGKKANRYQNILHALYFQCKEIKRTIDQYEILVKGKDVELDKIMDKYPNLFFTTINSMRYRIIIGMGNVFDSNTNSLSFEKVINIFEQVDSDSIKIIIKKYRSEITKYGELKDDIKLFRDKMYGHIDIKYSLENEEIFEIDFDFLDKQINNSRNLISYIMETCVNLSCALDNDSLSLCTNWKFDK